MFVHKQAHGQRAGHALLLRYDPGFCPAAPPCAPEPALGEPVVVPVALLPEAVEAPVALYVPADAPVATPEPMAPL